MRRILTGILISSAAVLGCAGDPAPQPAPSPSERPSSENEPVTTPDADASSVTPDGAAPNAPGPTTMHFTAPDGWITEEPSSSMRAAQYVLPADTEGVDDATLVVFYFGRGGAGAVEANLTRWYGQFAQADGSATVDSAQRSETTINGMRTTLVAVTGTYVAETRPGSGQRVNKPGYSMLAAIMESNHGPYFIKLVGPEAVVTAWEESYHEFLNNVRLAK